MFQLVAERKRLPRWRVIVAYVIAPAVAAVGLAIAQPLYAGLPDYVARVWRSALAYGLVGAFPATVVVGRPAYLMLRRRVAPTPLRCAAVGAVVAALPWAVLALLGTPDQASVNGRATVVNGITTAYGWLNLGQELGSIALIGAATGLLFWLIAAAGAKTAPTAGDD